MFSRVTMFAADLAASERFYDTVLAPLGLERDQAGGWGELRLAQADDEHPATRGLHIAFVAPSREHVDAFWEAGTGAGYGDDGEPGRRPQYGDDYYGGFLRDPDGNSAEAVHHDALRAGGIVDHLWIRVSDLADSRHFYTIIAPYATLALETDESDRIQFRGETGSFSLLAGTPTEHVHMTFPGDAGGLGRAAREAGLRTDGDAAIDPDGNVVTVETPSRPGPTG